MLADECQKRVVIVDTSNEIGGDSNISHPGVGGARRMQVPMVEQQHRVMIEVGETLAPPPFSLCNSLSLSFSLPGVDQQH